MNNTKTNIKTNIKIHDTTSFLKSVKTSELNINEMQFEHQDPIDIITNKYLNLKQKINLFWNKTS